MKKTYITPEVLAVALLPQNGILVEGSVQHIGGNGPGGDVNPDDPSDPGYTGADVKGLTSQGLWDNEW